MRTALAAAEKKSEEGQAAQAASTAKDLEGSCWSGWSICIFVPCLLCGCRDLLRMRISALLGLRFDNEDCQRSWAFKTRSPAQSL